MSRVTQLISNSVHGVSQEMMTAGVKSETTLLCISNASLALGAP